MSKQAFVVELNKSGKYQRLINPGDEQSLSLKAGRVYLEPGASCGEHSTEGREEALVFLSGSGVAYIGEQQQKMEVGAGKVAYIPPNTVHNIENTASEPLIYVFIVSPVG